MDANDETAPDAVAIAAVEVEQTDNRPRPEDGEQDVDQEPTPVEGSPTGDDA